MVFATKIGVLLMSCLRREMRIVSNILLPLIIAFTFIACENGIQKGTALSKEDLAFIQELGILDENEEIILFHSQSGKSDEVKEAGNFFTEKRIAAYWLDISSENAVNSALYSEIDTIRTFDKTKQWSQGSYLEIRTKDSIEFRVYVNGDSSSVWNFFNRASQEWKKRR